MPPRTVPNKIKECEGRNNCNPHNSFEHHLNRFICRKRIYTCVVIELIIRFSGTGTSHSPAHTFRCTRFVYLLNVLLQRPMMRSKISTCSWKLTVKYHSSSLLSSVSSKFLFRCVLRFRPMMSSASLKVRATSASDLLLFNALPSSFSKPEDLIRISLRSECDGYRLFESFNAISCPISVKFGINGAPVDARCSFLCVPCQIFCVLH